MSQIKLAVIGFGRIGKIHAENILHMQDVELVQVIDPILDKDSHLFDSKTIISKDLEALTTIGEIDGVIICSPSIYHIDQIKTAANKIKNIFCEKPLALTKISAENSINACERAGVVLGVGLIVVLGVALELPCFWLN